jgi:hypothetical protein
MNSYHFDVGNSNQGPVGFCARIRANSPEEALERLRFLLPESSLVFEQPEHEEYIDAYFNPDALTLDHIDVVDPVEPPGPRRTFPRRGW